MNRTVKRAWGCNRFFVGCAVFSAVISSTAGSAAAYSERLAVNRFGQRGLLHLYSAHTLGAGTMALGFYGDGTLDQNFLKRSQRWDPRDSTFDTASNKNPAISTFNCNPFIGIGLADFFDVSAMLPLDIDMLGNSQEVGIGDMQLTFKIGTASGVRTPVFDLGLLGALIVPTGSEKTGVFPRHTSFFNKDSLAVKDTAIVGSFFSSQKVDFEAHALLALDLGALRGAAPLALSVDYGMRFATQNTRDDAVLMSAALQYRPVNSLALVAEFSSEMRLYNFTHGFKMNRDPLRLSPCIAYAPSNGFMLTLGTEISLASRAGTFAYVKRWDENTAERITAGIEPKWRTFVQVGWSGVFADRDRDRDGIVDRYDRCPEVPEDVDGFQDDDGCPDYDNDNDGIPDSLDKCPNKPEDKDGFQDEDGCPDYDNDKDNVPDSVDQCPNFKEDYDGFEDRDGCPDNDNDRDGVPDGFDRCPNVPEDIDGFQDADGCPDVDNDQDGVPDTLDKCPDQAGSPENNGCQIVEQPKPAAPKAKEIKRGRVVLRGVTFEKGTAVIEPSSYTTLDELARSLSDWPLMQIEIQGHTDNQGSAVHQRELSKNRAEAVRNYLVNKGISATRLAAVGKSDGSPLGDNATRAGRAINNRIELRRTDP
jgi:outer membrane protein OmpA-like peptidoglycan-associated protein